MPDDRPTSSQPANTVVHAPADDFELGAFPANMPTSLKDVLARGLEGLRPDALSHLPLPARQRAISAGGVTMPVRAYTRADAETRRQRVEATSYRMGDALVDAVHVALLLRQPLLLTGEPGVGKTAFAEALAARLGLDVETVSVKSTTLGRDLLYDFDEVGRFRNASEKEKRGLRDFVTLRGLGLAVARGLGPSHLVKVGRSLVDVLGEEEARAVQNSGTDGIPLGKLFPKAFAGSGGGIADEGTITVVLLDEFDKAVRDTPNDLLLELERLKIEIRELDATLDLGLKPWNWPIVLITTNDERSLPPPFLRRCVHHHMTLPDDALTGILLGKLPRTVRDGEDGTRAASLAHALNTIRKDVDAAVSLSRRPGTAEYIGAFYLLMDRGAEVNGGTRFTLPQGGAQRATLLAQVCAVLAKTPEDKIALSSILNSWVRPPGT